MSGSQRQPSARGDPNEPDRRSRRVALAVSLLRRGHPCAQVAKLTAVPFALVEWLSEHITPPDQYIAPNADTVTSTPPVLTDDQLLRLRYRLRWRARALAATITGWLATYALATVAALTHHRPLGASAVLMTAVMAALTIVVLVTSPRAPYR